MSLTVTFNKNGGSTEASPATISVEAGARLSNYPATNPTRAGYSFAGWYTTPQCYSIFNIKTNITTDVTLYAKWIKNSFFYNMVPLEEVMEPRDRFFPSLTDSSRIEGYSATSAFPSSFSTIRNNFASFDHEFYNQVVSPASLGFKNKGASINASIIGGRPRYMSFVWDVEVSETTTYYIGRSDSSITIYNSLGGEVTSISSFTLGLEKAPFVLLFYCCGGGGGGGGSSWASHGGGGGGGARALGSLYVPTANGTSGRKLVIGGPGTGGTGSWYGEPGGHGADTIIYYDNNSTHYITCGGGRGGNDGNTASGGSWGGAGGTYSRIDSPGIGGSGGRGGQTGGYSIGFDAYQFSRERSFFKGSVAGPGAGKGNGGSSIGTGVKKGYSGALRGAGGGGGNNPWPGVTGHGSDGGGGYIALYY